MSKKTEDGFALVAAMCEQFSKDIESFCRQVPVSERPVNERLAARLAKLAAFFALKAGLDPTPFLLHEIANLHVTDQAMRGTGEEAPRIAGVVNPMDADELNTSAEPLREVIRQMALAGVPAKQAAMILLTFAAQILLQETDNNNRAVSLLIATFAAEVDKGRFDQRIVM